MPWRRPAQKHGIAIELEHVGRAVLNRAAETDEQVASEDREPFDIGALLMREIALLLFGRLGAEALVDMRADLFRGEHRRLDAFGEYDLLGDRACFDLEGRPARFRIDRYPDETERRGIVLAFVSRLAVRADHIKCVCLRIEGGAFGVEFLALRRHEADFVIDLYAAVLQGDQDSGEPFVGRDDAAHQIGGQRRACDAADLLALRYFLRHSPRRSGRLEHVGLRARVRGDAGNRTTQSQRGGQSGQGCHGAPRSERLREI